MDIKITEQPLLVWIWVVSTLLAVADARMGLGWVGSIASLVFVAGVLWFLVIIILRLE
ncbi:MAG: hypothetical protein ACI9K3_001213 [Halovenus sp.]|jgi:hypothetical protein